MLKQISVIIISMIMNFWVHCIMAPRYTISFAMLPFITMMSSGSEILWYHHKNKPCFANNPVDLVFRVVIVLFSRKPTVRILHLCDRSREPTPATIARWKENKSQLKCIQGLKLVGMTYNEYFSLWSKVTSLNVSAYSLLCSV